MRWGVDVCITKVPRAKKAEPNQHGEFKQRYQIMLTASASDELDRVSENLGITRSELVEKVIRQGLLEQVVMDDAKSA